jgi:hypothetical protein
LSTHICLGLPSGLFQSYKITQKVGGIIYETSLVHKDLLSMAQCQIAKNSWCLERNCLLPECQADGNILQKNLHTQKYINCQNPT